MSLSPFQRIALTLTLTLGCAAALPVYAQNDARLAEIRAGLAELSGTLNALRSELSAASGTTVNIGSTGSALMRLDAIEAELRALTGRTEEIEFKIDSIVRDGTSRVGDLAFRLCDLEPSCDIAELSATDPLGQMGIEARASTPAVQTAAPVVLGEEGAFNAAKSAFDAANWAEAATKFADFTAAYPGGPFATRAYVLRGEALGRTGEWSGAARAFLDAFSSAPTSPEAPRALMGLGSALGNLGQVNEACMTLSEVPLRYPNSDLLPQVQSISSSFNCS